jgi:hypothetical protein
MRNFAEKENWFRSLKLAPKSTAQLNSLVAWLPWFFSRYAIVATSRKVAFVNRAPGRMSFWTMRSTIARSSSSVKTRFCLPQRISVWGHQVESEVHPGLKALVVALNVALKSSFEKERSAKDILQFCEEKRKCAENLNLKHEETFNSKAIFSLVDEIKAKSDVTTQDFGNPKPYLPNSTILNNFSEHFRSIVNHSF